MNEPGNCLRRWRCTTDGGNRSDASASCLFEQHIQIEINDKENANLHVKYTGLPYFTVLVCGHTYKIFNNNYWSFNILNHLFFPTIIKKQPKKQKQLQLLVVGDVSLLDMFPSERVGASLKVINSRQVGKRKCYCVLSDLHLHTAGSQPLAIYFQSSDTHFRTEMFKWFLSQRWVLRLYNLISVFIKLCLMCLFFLPKIDRFSIAEGDLNRHCTEKRVNHKSVLLN